MYKIFFLALLLLGSIPAKATTTTFELSEYDVPLLYHVISKEPLVSTKDIARLVVDGKLSSEPIYNISNQLIRAWNSNNEFMAHDNYAAFISIIKQRTGLIDAATFMSIVDFPTNFKEDNKMVYNFEKKGFDIHLPFGNNKIDNMPPNFRCTVYSGKLICLDAINQKESEFIAMNENEARAVSALKESNRLLIRQVFRHGKSVKLIPPANGHPVDTAIIQVLLTNIELYQCDQNGNPIKRIGSITK